MYSVFITFHHGSSTCRISKFADSLALLLIHLL